DGPDRRLCVHGPGRSAHGGDGLPRQPQRRPQDSQPARVQEPDHARDVRRRDLRGRRSRSERPVWGQGMRAGSAAPGAARGRERRIRRGRRAHRRGPHNTRKGVQGAAPEGKGGGGAVRTDGVPGYRVARADPRAATVGGGRWEGGARWRGPRTRARGPSTLMLRLPSFTYLQPKALQEALAMKADAGPDGMYVAGGKDLYPNMKSRHQEPKTVISLMGIPELGRLDGRTVGPCVTLSALSNSPTVRQSYDVISHAARLVSTPLLRNMGTLGGNLCLDT